MRRTIALAGLSLAFLSGCAGAPITKGMDPEQLLDAACEPGRSVKKVDGSVWMQAKSKDASGQFPADVVAESPSKLQLLVTNMIGATEAVITVEGAKYQIKVPGKKGKKDQVQKGQDSWGGIPLRWSTDLFLGRVPCPDKAALEGGKLTIDNEGALVAETKAGERFSYRFKSWEGRVWPEALAWEGPGKASKVDFKFQDPEEKTRSPKKWEAVSELGEVKVRWKDRDAKI